MKKLLLAALSLLAAVCPAQIAYVKGGGLYVLPCDKSGEPSRGERALFVCPIRRFLYDDFSLIYTRDGQIVFGGQWGGASYVWQVAARKGAKPRKLCSGQWPELSPDGKRLLVDRDWTEVRVENHVKNWFGHTDAYVVDLSTGREQRIARDVDGLCYWLPDGQSIAYSQGNGEGDNQPSVIELPTLQSRAVFDRVVNASFDGVSPDGKTLAVTGGPVEGRWTSFVDAVTRGNKRISTEVEKYGDKRGSAIYFEDWSPDSGHVLLDLEMQEPDGDHWVWHAIALGDLGTRKSRLLPHSATIREAKFSSDGTHIVCLERRDGSRRARLTVFDLQQPNRRRTLASGVSEFAVRP